MTNKGILFAGLPKTGKTTFIAALWYYIFNRYSNQEYTVSASENEEREYLNTRTSEWTSCEPVLRTSLGIIEHVSISMSKKATNEIIKLNIPDISGEALKRQFSSREWKLDFEDIMNNANGILLFVDPMDDRNTPKFIYQNNSHYKVFDEKAPSPEKSEAWSVENVPNQVKLVDFLQAVNYHCPGRIQSISVIISCWDLVERTLDPQVPEEWCKKKMPLLYQFLKANNSLFSAKYFGVSAQGGNYEDEEEKKLLFSRPILERIIVVEGQEKSNDILSPILWITNENKN